MKSSYFQNPGLVGSGVWPPYTSSKRGRIDVIAGPMGTGKSERLIEMLMKAESDRQSVLAVRSALDTRSAPGWIESQSGRIRFEAIECRTDAELVAVFRDTKGINLLAVDEAHMLHFDCDLPGRNPLLTQLCVERAGHDEQDTLIAGIALDNWGRPFEPVASLMAFADSVEKRHRQCDTSGCRKRVMTDVRQNRSAERIVAGGSAEYLGLCFQHFEEWSGGGE